jgi:hypothetical protein
LRLRVFALNGFSGFGYAVGARAKAAQITSPSRTMEFVVLNSEKTPEN